MTEYWKSNPMFWCEYCKVWLQDKPGAKATHERGIKHKDNVTRKLREMRLKADKEVKEGRLAAATMGDIDAKARAQYEDDLRDAHKTSLDTAGVWTYIEEDKLHYNERHGYYYSTKTQMYYGGDPAAWTLEPAMPAEARYPEQSSSAAAPKAGKAVPGAGAKRFRVNLDAHPMGRMGGDVMPSFGAIGGARGLGVAGAPRQAQKRAADHGRPGKEVSEEEAAALARREAARARVKSRDMAAFGLK